MSVADDPPRNGFAVRVATLEREVRRLLDLEPAVQRNRIDQHDKDFVRVDQRFEDVLDELKGVRRALYTVAASVLLIGVGAILTALQIAG
jgi:hypothetical protein